MSGRRVFVSQIALFVHIVVELSSFGAQNLDQRKSLSILKYLIYLPWHWDLK